MKTYLKIITAAALFAMTSANAAAPKLPETSDIAKNVAPLLHGLAVEQITPTDHAGLYELVTPAGIFYTDKAGSFVIFNAALVDTKSKVNLTEQRLNQLSAFKFSELPFQDAIKTVKGNGKRVMVTFEDPNCGYCKRLMSEINKLDNVTVYTFLIPILSPDSETKARTIWCAPDRSQVWSGFMSGTAALPKQGATDCDTPLQRNLALSRKLHINGTPALLFADDTKIPGFKPASDLETKLGK
jgi:thiol:disulfide interchange protein DsbC